MHPLAIQRIRPRLSCQPLVAAVFSARSTVSPHCYQTWSTPEWRSYFVSSASTSAATMRPAPERQDACNQARARMKGSVLINDETSFAAALHRLNVPIRGSGSTAAGYRHFRVGRPNHAGAADPFGQQVWLPTGLHGTCHVVLPHFRVPPSVHREKAMLARSPRRPRACTLHPLTPRARTSLHAGARQGVDARADAGLRDRVQRRRTGPGPAARRLNLRVDRPALLSAGCAAPGAAA